MKSVDVDDDASAPGAVVGSPLRSFVLKLHKLFKSPSTLGEGLSIFTEYGDDVYIDLTLP